MKQPQGKKKDIQFNSESKYSEAGLNTNQKCGREIFGVDQLVEAISAFDTTRLTDTYDYLVKEEDTMLKKAKKISIETSKTYLVLHGVLLPPKINLRIDHDNPTSEAITLWLAIPT